MLELDCQLTADGEVVVAHDDHLLRLCDVDAYIHDLRYAQLPKLLTSLPLDFDKSRQDAHLISVFISRPQLLARRDNWRSAHSNAA